MLPQQILPRNQVSIVINLDCPLTRTYMFYAAFLAVKLLALSPIAALTWVRKGLFQNTDIVRRAYLAELKNLSPFWIVGAIYVTTDPPEEIGIMLFRSYTFARLLVTFGYASNPLSAVITDLSIVISYIITVYMAIYVIYFYRKAL
ncbi:hypothetical protein K1T71_001410 [Dendrolimus kikuchii]|uniref:Uncharacterized protein n=1 Tax=Dendrolimus kikuchii TaxID=765133 RepID=A0ACC1DHJ0_9NEOP|nr:hypothetical protein K1T71_001410 [Dendrolimus kikuchii]